MLFTAVFSAGSIVWDREFGFLRGCWSLRLVVGRLSSASASVAQQSRRSGASSCWRSRGLVGVPYNPIMIVLVVAELMLIALMITAFGVMVAARIKTFQAFMAMTRC